MVSTTWERLESVMGVKPLTVVALRDALGVSYQAAAKIQKGGGLSRDNALKLARKYGVNPEWLATGKEPKMSRNESPPPAPSPNFADTRTLTEEQWEQYQAFSIAATTDEKAAIIERYEALKKIAKQVYGPGQGEKR